MKKIFYFFATLALLGSALTAKAETVDIKWKDLGVGNLTLVGQKTYTSEPLSFFIYGVANTTGPKGVEVGSDVYLWLKMLNYITVSCQEGYVLKSIVLNSRPNYDLPEITINNGTIVADGLEKATWTASDNETVSVQLKMGGIAYIGTTTVTYENAAGETIVETIEAADNAAEYYNLQGQRVANPEKGIFVKVANGKATKVVK